MRKLKGLARNVGRIVGVYGDGPDGPMRVIEVLRGYAEEINPWARTTAAGLLTDVSRRDKQAWGRYSNLMGLELQREIDQSPTGEVMQRMMNEQVELITSIPLDAAERVHKSVTANLYNGGRSSEVAKVLQTTEQVTMSRAKLIARTETGRASGELTKSRALYIGSPGYIWRTAEDEDVRSLHKKLDGKFIRWDEPPIAGENGERAHAGCIYNCRCYMEPVLP